MPGTKVPEEHRRTEILRAAYDVAAREGVEALTLRAVAERAVVSHGTVLFHFRRRDELVASLLDDVLSATTELRASPDVEKLTDPSERLRALLRAEMHRLSAEPRHFRLFLEYWALGVRNAAIRKRVSAAIERYRAAFRDVAATVLRAGRGTSSPGRNGARPTPPTTADGVAAVAVSLIHGCALQAVIDPRVFSVQQHYRTAARMLHAFGVERGAARPRRESPARRTLAPTAAADSA